MKRATPAQLRQAIEMANLAHAHEWDINTEGTATVCHCGARSSDEQETQAKGRLALIAEAAEKRT